MQPKYQTYFEFIRFSLNAEQPYNEAFQTIDWADFLSFCHKQTLTGVCLDGLARLGKGQGPERTQLAQWVHAGQKIVHLNKQMNATAHQVCAQLTRDGLQNCVLKGQGNALLYPNPYSRTPGDIDVWVYGASRRTIMDYVRSHFEELESLRYHHIGCKRDGVSVEVHFVPATMNCPWYNRRLQRFFREHGLEQCAHSVALPDGAGEISTPTDNFNAVYQLSHLLHHFFDDGIGLRQMLDYYFVIRRLSPEEKRALPGRLRQLGLYRFGGAVMYVLHHVLGLPTSEMPLPIDERRGRVLLDEIIDGGNFGKEFSKYGAFTRQGTAKKYFLKVYRNLHFAALYPAESLSEPLFRTWHWAWRLFHH